MTSKPASTQGSPSQYTKGTRLSFDGALCTVRYVGEIQGTKGEWLGIEWDDPSRGKHSGQHQGVEYFQCKRNHPTAGSFVRPGRPTDKPLSFLEAAHEKYASDFQALQKQSEDGGGVPEGVSNPIMISGKVVEEVGFDRIRKQLAALNELSIIILDGLQVNGVVAGQADALQRNQELERIKQTCPKIQELNLSRNLLSDWEDIADICKQLDELKILKLNGNRFNDVEVDSVIFEGITDLLLNDTLMEWKEISALSYKFPSLTNLSFSSNQLSGLCAPISPTIKHISLEFNNFESLDCLRCLVTLPNLQRLSLRGNKLNRIHASQNSDNNDSTTSNSPLVLSSTLNVLDVSLNQINDWSFIHHFPSVFPGLTGLRISDNLLYRQPPAPPNVTGLPDKAMTVDEAYMLTLARLPQLKILNYGKITQQDRTNGELYYLSLIRKELLGSPPSEEKRILDSHIRYKELCEIYDVPEVKRAENNVTANPRSLGAQLVNFKFHMQKSRPLYNSVDNNATAQNSTRATKNPGNPKDEFDIEIPKTYDIYRVKAIVARQFSLPPLHFKLIWETEEWDPVEEGTAEEDEWDSEDESETELSSSPPHTTQTRRYGKSFARREEELVDSTREIGHWFGIDVQEARVRIVPFDE